VPHPISPLKNPHAIFQGCTRHSQRRRWLVPLVVLLGLVGTLGNAFVVVEPAGAATTRFVSPAQNFTLTVTAQSVPSSPAPSLSGGARLAALPNATGYWIVQPDGGVFSYGAPFLGSLPGIGIHVSNIVGIASTADGGGYWLVGSDGEVFAFGDAAFMGSIGGTPLNKPMVAMAATPDGKGYWLVASDGGVFAFGQAVFVGSEGNSYGPLPPIIGLYSSDGGAGYTLVDELGAAYAFGPPGL
jgi:hypothetical protein